MRPHLQRMLAAQERMRRGMQQMRQFARSPVAPGAPRGAFGLSGSVLGSEPVSAGPVWVGDTALVSDGSVYLAVSGGFDATAPYEAVFRFMVTTGTPFVFPGALVSGTKYNQFYPASGNFYNYIYNSVQRSVSVAFSPDSAYHVCSAQVTAANYPAISIDGGALTVGGSTQSPPGAGSDILIGARSSGVSPSGLYLAEFALYDVALSDDDRDALANLDGGGVPQPCDWREQIATQPVAYFDMANNQDDGASGWEVLDLMGGSAAAVVGGDGGNFV